MYLYLFDQLQMNLTVLWLYRAISPPTSNISLSVPDILIVIVFLESEAFIRMRFERGKVHDLISTIQPSTGTQLPGCPENLNAGFDQLVSLSKTPELLD